MYVEVKNNKRLYDLTQEQLNILKDYLTYDNPKYKDAKRYSRNRYTKIPPYLYYYSEGNSDRGHYIDVPIGVDVEKVLKYKISPVKHKRDAGLFSHHFPCVDYPEFLLELRGIQKEALHAYYTQVGVASLYQFPKSLISLPTGKGKTILALKLAAELRTRALVLVHKDDLVEGWKNDIALCFGDSVSVGIIKAKKREVGKHITIATVQTLSRMSEEELSNYTDKFGLVIQDECHHCAINMFNIIDSFNSHYKLGLSATPKRSDGLDFVFDLFFGGICYEYKAGKDDEDISNVEVRVIDSHYKYRPFVHKGEVFNLYDFKEEELPDDYKVVEELPYTKRPTIPHSVIDNLAVKSPKTKIAVCNKIVEHFKKGHSCLVLFSQKEHINSYYRFLSHFIPRDQIMLYYGDNKEKSSFMMERAEKREVLVTLATYAKATEGTNVKAWEVEFLVSSINNEKNTEQATGRIRRRKDGKLDPVIVYDVRYSGCYSLRSHYNTRLKVYKELDYSVKDSKSNNKSTGTKKPLFSRGYYH